VGWLKSVQNDDGGWGFYPGDASDANSTSAAAGTPHPGAFGHRPHGHRPRAVPRDGPDAVGPGRAGRDGGERDGGGAGRAGAGGR
ncbi:hypothetical protein AB0E18_31870, partial [Streptomyces sp. NPDC047968]